MAQRRVWNVSTECFIFTLLLIDVPHFQRLCGQHNAFLTHRAVLVILVVVIHMYWASNLSSLPPEQHLIGYSLQAAYWEPRDSH